MNVIDYGAQMNGADDSAAFAAARAACPNRGRIYVPPGIVNTPSFNPVDPYKKVVWVIDSAFYPNGNNVFFIGSDTVENMVEENQGGVWIGQGITNSLTGDMAKYRRDFTHYDPKGSDPGNNQKPTDLVGVANTLKVETNVGTAGQVSEPGSFVWGLTSVLHDYSHKPIGNNVAIYGQYWKQGNSTTPGWAGCFEARDKTQLPSSQTGPLLGAEFDIFGSNYDDADKRYGIDVVVGHDPESTAHDFMEAANGVRISSVFQKGVSERTKSWFKRGINIDSGISIAAMDVSGAFYRDGTFPIGLRLGGDKYIDFVDDKSRAMRWQSDGRLVYKVNGNPYFSVWDNGVTETKRIKVTDVIAATSDADAASKGVEIGELYRNGNQAFFRIT